MIYKPLTKENYPKCYSTLSRLVYLISEDFGNKKYKSGGVFFSCDGQNQLKDSFDKYLVSTGYGDIYHTNRVDVQNDEVVIKQINAISDATYCFIVLRDSDLIGKLFVVLSTFPFYEDLKIYRSSVAIVDKVSQTEKNTFDVDAFCIERPVDVLDFEKINQGVVLFLVNLWFDLGVGTKEYHELVEKFLDMLYE